MPSHDTPGQTSPPGRWSVWAVAAAVFAFSWVFRFNDPNGGFAGLTDDHFFYLVRGWQILLGELPVRDFVDHGAPLYFYLSAAVQWLLGRGTLSELVFSTTMLALGAALTFWLSARASGSTLLGLLGAAFHVFLMPRFYNYPKVLVYTAAIPLLWWLADRPGARPVAWLAVVTVLGFLLRHDHGAFVAIATLAMLLAPIGIPTAQRVRYALLYGAAVVVLLAPYVLFVQLNGGLQAYVANATDWASKERGRTPVVFPGLFDNPDGVSDAAGSGSPPARALAVIRDNGVAWLYYFELALPLFALAVVAISRNACRGRWNRAGPKIAVVALLGLVLDAGFLRSPLAARLADPSVPLAILIAWLALAVPRLAAGSEWWRPSLASAGIAGRIVLAAVAVAFAAVPAIVLSHGLYDRLENANMVEGLRPITGRATNVMDALRRDWDLETWRNRNDRPELITLAMYLNQCTPPDARVFVQPYVPQVISLARRGFAGGYADLRPGFFDTPEAEFVALQRMRSQNIPVVLLETGDSLENFRESFPLIARYFDENYETAGEHEFDGRLGITLLVKRGAPRGEMFDLLPWPCLYPQGERPGVG